LFIISVLKNIPFLSNNLLLSRNSFLGLLYFCLRNLREFKLIGNQLLNDPTVPFMPPFANNHVALLGINGLCMALLAEIQKSLRVIES
jgi:hypothetical protein